ncbi:MAG: BamA/TamA family outer membrane protein [Candidatus Eremiobacteraeota bacterium]|nr:BamA/TamA family outer membrane protein [Candidatus Eremiobacteraeota bacterium]
MRRYIVAIITLIFLVNALSPFAFALGQKARTEKMDISSLDKTSDVSDSVGKTTVSQNDSDIENDKDDSDSQKKKSFFDEEKKRIEDRKKKKNGNDENEAPVVKEKTEPKEKEKKSEDKPETEKKEVPVKKSDSVSDKNEDEKASSSKENKPDDNKSEAKKEEKPVEKEQVKSVKSEKQEAEKKDKPAEKPIKVEEKPEEKPAVVEPSDKSSKKVESKEPSPPAVEQPKPPAKEEEINNELNLDPDTEPKDPREPIADTGKAGDAKKAEKSDKEDVKKDEKAEGKEVKEVKEGEEKPKKASPGEEKPDFLKKPLPAERESSYKITAIEVRGNEHVPTEKILSVIRSKVGDILLKPRLRSDVQSIYEMGFFNDVKLDTPYYAGGIKLVYRVQENPVVKKITILGNKIVSTDKLLELIQTKVGSILNMRTLNADLSEINYYYNEALGYELKPTHIKNVNFTSSGELVLSIKEGMVVKQVDVTGSTLFPEKEMQSLVKMKPGELFNTKQVKKDSTSLSEFYKEEGYILDTIRPQVNYKEGIVSYQIIEAVVENIRIEISPAKGRTKPKTKEYVVMRNIRTKKGEVLQQDKLKKDIDRLNRRGYFSRVNVDPEPGSEPGKVVLVFKLKEQKTGLATIGVGYAGGGSSAVRSGITGAISFSDKNLGGTGQGAGLSWQRGVNIDNLSASYSNPAINKNQDSFSLSVFRHNYLELKQPLDNEINNTKYALYDDKRIGGSAVYGRRITDDLRLFLSFRREQIQISRNPNSDYEPIGISKGTLNAAGVGALYDTRNSLFDPTEGAYGDLAFTYAGDVLRGSYDFKKYQLELRKYFPIGRKKKSAIALRAWGGILKGDSNKTPVTETFYVGGTDTIRGYGQNEFFGTRMIVLNAEYRFPIAGIKYLKGAVFADAGNAWFPGDERQRLYSDVGLGLRIVYPTLGLGVIRVDYASGENGGRFSVGIGQTF